MARLSLKWPQGRKGVWPSTAEQLQSLLRPGETLQYVLAAQTRRTAPRLALYELLKKIPDVVGEAYVVITDRALLVVDRRVLVGDRRLYADLPLPSTLGPVSGRGWIVLDGKPIFVLGGRRALERAEAVLRAQRRRN